jgi:hypothetical protein
MTLSRASLLANTTFVRPKVTHIRKAEVNLALVVLSRGYKTDCTMVFALGGVLNDTGVAGVRFRFSRCRLALDLYAGGFVTAEG